MRNQSLVSVNLCCYNSEKYLHQTTDSVLGQTYPNWELVAINDGSTDGTGEILAAYAAADKRIRVYTQTNQGLAKSRNNAIKYSLGDSIAFIDHDDWWERSKLEKQMAALEQNPDAAIVYADCVYVGSKGKSIQLGSKVGKTYSGMVFQWLLERDFIALSTAIVRKSVIDELGGFSEAYSILEDHELFLRVAEKYPVILVDEPLMFYRVHGSNYSKDYVRKYEEEQLLLSSWLARFADGDPKKRRVKEAVAVSHVRYAVYSILKAQKYAHGVRKLLSTMLNSPIVVPAVVRFSVKSLMHSIPRLYFSLKAHSS